jgi:hypothetical protein
MGVAMTRGIGGHYNAGTATPRKTFLEILEDLMAAVVTDFEYHGEDILPLAFRRRKK